MRRRDRLARLAARRHFVERGFRNAKSRLGMHQFQVRMWCAWHHHMALVMLAYVLAETVRRRYRDALSLMSLNDVVLVAIQVCAHALNNDNFELNKVKIVSSS